MNRENKRKQYEKGYYKTHGCNDSFICKVCGRPVVPTGAGSDHRIIAQTAFAVYIWILNPEIERQIAAESWTPWVFGSEKWRWAIIHRCRRCGHLSSNRIAADDNPMKLMSIAMKPLSQPPFPLEKIEEMTALMGGDGQLFYG